MRLGTSSIFLTSSLFFIFSSLLNIDSLLNLQILHRYDIRVLHYSPTRCSDFDWYPPKGKRAGWIELVNEVPS